MLIKDILEFNRKKYFGGAVQANWFYDNDMAADIASSYVFHGPKYHGVGETDHNDLRYKLYDTASYAHILFRKAYDDTNRFNMTIAGYGTGKSHLSVTLASLLSGHDEQLLIFGVGRDETGEDTGFEGGNQAENVHFPHIPDSHPEETLTDMKIVQDEIDNAGQERSQRKPAKSLAFELTALFPQNQEGDAEHQIRVNCDQIEEPPVLYVSFIDHNAVGKRLGPEMEVVGEHTQRKKASDNQRKP